MKRTVLGIATAAGMLLVASPALAATWQCTAQNARGANYTAVAVGVYSGVVHDKAAAKALAKCRPNSVAPASCHIVSCTRTN